MKKIIWITVVTLVAAVAVFGFIGKNVASEAVAGERFEGSISSVDTSCFSDGICSVTVDGKIVIIAIGGRRTGAFPEVGTLRGVESIGDVELHVGEKASVYAAKTAEGTYTIYGSADYYVEVLKGK